MSGLGTSDSSCEVSRVYARSGRKTNRPNTVCPVRASAPSLLAPSSLSENGLRKKKSAQLPRVFWVFLLSLAKGHAGAEAAEAAASVGQAVSTLC